MPGGASDAIRLNAEATYHGSDGEATRALYRTLEAIGPLGFIAENLFRAEKASARAKVYQGGIRGKGSYRKMAYQRKQWSLDNLCEALQRHAETAGLTWGWGRDDQTVNFPWVLYIELPTGQASFHSPVRHCGPDYSGQWDGMRGESHKRVIAWVQQILDDHPGATVSDDAAAVTDDSLMPFGKHRGTPLKDVPHEYLAWLGDQPWLRDRPGLLDYVTRALRGPFTASTAPQEARTEPRP